MHSNYLFNTGSISYSQFLSRKEKHSYQFKKKSHSLIDRGFFKRSLAFHYQHVYAYQKWKNWLYCFLFFALSLLFIILGFLMFFKTVNFTYGLYFKNPMLIKNGVNFFSFALAAAAFIIGRKIHPEKDAMQYIISKVQRELNHPAKHLAIEFHAILANLPNEFISGETVELYPLHETPDATS